MKLRANSNTAKELIPRRKPGKEQAFQCGQVAFIKPFTYVFT